MRSETLDGIEKILSSSSWHPDMDGDLNEQALSNCFVVALSRQEMMELGVCSLVKRFLEFEDNVRSEWSIDCCFYLWFDEQARHFRFSSIDAHAEPPFKAKLVDAQLEDVVEFGFKHLDVRFDGVTDELLLYQRIHLARV